MANILLLKFRCKTALLKKWWKCYNNILLPYSPGLLRWNRQAKIKKPSMETWPTTHFKTDAWGMCGWEETEMVCT